MILSYYAHPSRGAWYAIGKNMNVYEKRDWYAKHFKICDNKFYDIFLKKISIADNPRSRLFGCHETNGFILSMGIRIDKNTADFIMSGEYFEWGGK